MKNLVEHMGRFLLYLLACFLAGYAILGSEITVQSPDDLTDFAPAQSHFLH